MKITAILASHNRRLSTLACLTSFFGSAHGSAVELTAVLVDDGSTDGTPPAVRDGFPDAEVLLGDGNLFWAGAMALAERAALRQNPDYLLWLNDDVILDPGGLAALLATARSGPSDSIAVGAVRDPATGAVSYSGVRRRGIHPLRVELVQPGAAPVPVDMFNGNVVLVPRAAAAAIGPIDGAFVHAAADYDYGLRARQAGIVNLLAPETVGTCTSNPIRDAGIHPASSRRERLRFLVGPKGAPPAARARYLRRHGGPAWMIFWLAPYVRAIPALVRPARTRTRKR